jgi:hypothetical protein
VLLKELAQSYNVGIAIISRLTSRTTGQTTKSPLLSGAVRSDQREQMRQATKIESIGRQKGQAMRSSALSSQSGDLASGTVSYQSNCVAARLNGTENRPQNPAV